MNQSSQSRLRESKILAEHISCLIGKVAVVKAAFGNILWFVRVIDYDDYCLSTVSVPDDKRICIPLSSIAYIAERDPRRMSIQIKRRLNCGHIIGTNFSSSHVPSEYYDSGMDAAKEASNESTADFGSSGDGKIPYDRTA
jgi:hypothetical protein